MPPRVLIVGCGNESRRDDGVGLYVIQQLALALGIMPEAEEDWSQLQGEVAVGDCRLSVELRFTHQLDITLADELRDYGLFIVVDAHTGAYSEALRREDVRPGYSSSLTSHHLTPDTLAGFSQALHGRAPRTIAFTIRGHDFNFGMELTPETQAAGDQAVTEIVELVLNMTDS